MTGYPGLNLQTAIYTALTGNATLMSAVSGVYDYVAEGNAFPYVVIGEFFSEPEDDKTTDGAATFINIHVFTRGRGKKTAHTLLGYIHDTLHNASLSVTGQQLVYILWDGLSTVLQEDTDNDCTYHGVMRFKALTRES